MKALLIALAVVLCCGTAYAACTGSSPTWETTPDYDSVSTCATNSSAGDTINVTAGDGDETWTGVISLKTGVKWIGPGKDNLIIRWSGTILPTMSAAFSATNVDDWRISGFNFTATGDITYEVAVYGSGCKGWRIDNNNFDGAATTPTTTILYPFWVTANATNDINGLFDSNTVTDGRILVPNNTVNTQAGWSALWYMEAPLGADGSGNAVYIEDNTFVRTKTGLLNLDSNRGARMVYRYNSFTNIHVMAHGWQDYGRGTRTWEAYGNTFAGASANQMVIFHMRSGTGTIFYNSLSGNYYGDIHLTDDRSEYTCASHGYCNDENLLAESLCDGDHVGDTNTDPNPATGHKDGWPCRDQIGRGKDATQWTTCQTGAGPAQASTPAYFWGNFRGETVVKAVVATDSNVSYDEAVTGLTAAHIKTNRDFYDYNPSYAGGGATVGDNTTGGVGCGTLASRPATCTAGVGYWATDQSCSDPSGMTGISPASTISGTLYKCTATDTWTAYYTPYTYPHPLRGEVTTYTVAADVSGSLGTVSCTSPVSAGATSTCTAAVSSGYGLWSVSGAGCNVTTWSWATYGLSIPVDALTANCSLLIERGPLDYKNTVYSPTSRPPNSKR